MVARGGMERKRLSSLRSSVEPPGRGFSEIEVVDAIHIYQPVTGASVALEALPVSERSPILPVSLIHHSYFCEH